MSEACADVDPIASVAWTLGAPLPSERGAILRSESAQLLDGLLKRCSRRRGAIEIALGEGLLALGLGDRLMRLKGYAGIGDYAREELGIAASTAHKMARLARALRDRPLLRDAVWAGEMTARQAQTLLPVARGEDEATWVARAARGKLTVRALNAAVRAATGTEPQDEEPWERVSFPVPPEVRPVLEEALELAGRVIGPTTPKWERIEAICQEYLGAHALPEGAARAAVLRAPIESGRLEALKEALEEQTGQWAYLDRVDPVVAPLARLATETDPWALDAEVRRLARLRQERDEPFGHLAMLMKTLELWRDARFASFAHYCSEALNMSERAVEQRIALERRLQVLPRLREAMRQGRISYEKARLIAWQADDETIEEFIAVAEAMTCIALRRKLEADEERQMCARGDCDFRAPQRVGELITEAFSAARKAAESWIPPAQCVRSIFQHFIDVWKEASLEKSTRQRKILNRDRHFCQVPGCSRAATQVHHVRFRSDGGGDESENLISVCAVHHLHGIHMGRIRVTGVAPDGLVWELGERALAAGNRTSQTGPAPPSA